MIAEHMSPILCAKGMSLNPHVDFAGCPALDVLLVPGGQGTRREVENDALIRFVAKQAASCKAMLSVCTGAFILQKAGLLAGKRATTHWASLDRLRECGGVTVIEERFVRDGNLWTSAGVSAGIDMTLAFIADQAGEEVAGKTQLGAEYYPSSVIYGHASASEKAPAYIKQNH